jgi:hypothetical protein
MSFDPISAIFGVAEKVIDRVWPDPAQRAQAAQMMAELKQKGDLAFLDADVKLLTGQMEINKLEAQHGGMFKGGWRPFVGWVCGVALAYKFVLYPFLVFIAQAIAWHTGGSPLSIELLPEIEWSELSVILMGMLGLSGMRTYEKRQSEKTQAEK